MLSLSQIRRHRRAKFDTNSKNRLIEEAKQRELSGKFHTRFVFAEFGSIERAAAKIPDLFAAIAFHRCVLPVPCIEPIIAFLKLLASQLVRFVPLTDLVNGKIFWVKRSEKIRLSWKNWQPISNREFYMFFSSLNLLEEELFSR